MTRSDKQLYKSVFLSLATTSAKLLVFTVSLGLMAFVVFHVMAFQ